MDMVQLHPLTRSLSALLLLLTSLSIRGQSQHTTKAIDLVPPEPNLQCNPCVDRPSLEVKAIAHGSKDALFWRQIETAAVQTARDMRIQFSFEFFDNDHDAMAAAIIESSTSPLDRPEALIVTIPSPIVQQAVRVAVEAGLPVFGMNSGYEVSKELGLAGFVAMDEVQGGAKAAATFLEILHLQDNVTDIILQELLDLEANITALTNLNSSDTNATVAFDALREYLDDTYKRSVSAVYVNHQPGNTALEYRFQGYQQALYDHPFYDFNIREMRIEDQATTMDALDQAFAESGCPDIVLLASSAILENATQALYKHTCTLSQRTLLATFDTSSEVYDAIAVGKLSFAVSQQQHLQGVLPVVFAATYVSTGERVASSNENPYGFYSSGPSIISIENLPAGTLQRCETEGFPVCAPGEVPVKDYGCPCIDRKKVTIAAVLHGNNVGRFWRAWDANMRQAGVDTGVDFQMELFNKQQKVEYLYTRMASKILAYCQAGVDGIIVGIPDESILPSIMECQRLNIPVIAVNGALRHVQSLGLVHHIGKNEFTSFYLAGKRMLEAGVKVGICAKHVGGDIMKTRCAGFEAAMLEGNAEYKEVQSSDFDCVACMTMTVEDAVADQLESNPNLDSVGLMMFAPKYTNVTLEVKKKHPGLIVAIGNNNADVNSALSQHKILFGMDGGSFMQGYMPIWLLTLLATTNMHLANTEIESGPNFILKPRSKASIECKDSFYQICPPPIDYDLNQLTSVRPVGYTLVSIVYTTALLFGCWTFNNRKHTIVSKSQPEFLAMIILGAVVMVSAIFPLGIDDSVASTDRASQACMAIPWCTAVGFTIMFAGIFCKIWRISRLMSAAKQFRRTKVTLWHVLPVLFALTIGNIVFLISWTAVDPMYYSREELCGAGDFSSVGTCKVGEANLSSIMLIFIVVINAIALVLANVEAYKARWMSEELSESKYIFINTVGMLQVGMMGIPLTLLLSENPVAFYFLCSILLFLVSESTLLLMFVPKMLNLMSDEGSRRLRKKKSTTGFTGHDNSSYVSGFSGMAGTSRRPTGSGFQISNASGIAGSSRRPTNAGISMCYKTDAGCPPDFVVGSDGTAQGEQCHQFSLRKMKELERCLREEEGVNTALVFEKLEIDGVVPQRSSSARLVTAAVLDACEGDTKKARQLSRQLGLYEDLEDENSESNSQISDLSSCAGMDNN